MNHKPKKTKVVVTVGPSTGSLPVLERLIRAGADVFRLNFSHGTHDRHARFVTLIRQASKAVDRTVAILADLQGPKIRTGITAADAVVTLKRGSTVSLRSGRGVCDDREIAVSYPHLLADVAVGQRILLNDGAVALRVRRIDRKAGRVVCTVENTGSYSSRKGVNFPDAVLRVPALTAKDRRDLTFLLGLDVDIVALSFVRKPDDLAPVNRMVRRSGRPLKVIAKIEKPEALEHLEGILDTCDGIMVARGDLGVETSPYRVPVLQKDSVTLANKRGKLVIVATQMLESMVKQPLPTRAESADVANAILDGTDALMLSAETAVGMYPVESVRTMARIACIIEKSAYYSREFVNLSLRGRYAPHAICEAAEWASRDLGGAPVLVFTCSGDTALYLSKVRNQSPVYAFSPNPRVANMLSLAWNTRSFVIPVARDITGMVDTAEAQLLARRLVRKGEQVVVISGTSPLRGATNVLRIKRVGER